MPTYDYLCDACNHKFELFQSITEPVKKKCPACKKSKLRRLFGTGAAVMFKGSGFYTTDYRSESYKAGQKSEKSSGESKSSESKAESKPANSGEKSSGKSSDKKKKE